MLSTAIKIVLAIPFLAGFVAGAGVVMALGG